MASSFVSRFAARLAHRAWIRKRLNESSPSSPVMRRVRRVNGPIVEVLAFPSLSFPSYSILCQPRRYFLVKGVDAAFLAVHRACDLVGAHFPSHATR